MKKLFPLVVFSLSFTAFLLFQSSCKKESNPAGPETPLPSVAIGKLVITPIGILVNSSTRDTIHLYVPASVKLIDSTVKLVKVDGSNNIISQLGQLYDDGSLSHSDEIKGDNVYSGVFSLTETNAGQVFLRVNSQVSQAAGIASGSSALATLMVYGDVSSSDFIGLKKTQDSAAAKLNTFLAGNPANLTTAMSQLASWFATQTSVQSVEHAGSTSISVLYKSGIYGGVTVSQQNATGGVVTRGGVASVQQRKNSRAIPVSRQTVGTVSGPAPFIRKLARPSDLDPRIIGNRNVLIYAPFETALAPYNEGPSVQTLFTTSGSDFDITYVKNQSANIAALANLTNYGFVLLATHGSEGKAFATGEIVDTTLPVYKSTYKVLLKAQKLAIWSDMTISYHYWIVSVNATIYAVRAPYIADLSGTFPNSVILNNSCESTMNTDLKDAFTTKGAKTYYGYDKVVNSNFCVANADTVVRRLAADLKTTGEAYMAGSDPSSPNAAFLILGQHDVHYADSLINGDFEFGKLDGWTRTGDGRVISQLGYLLPTGGSYMGIVSTGLGYTTEMGRISQTFHVAQNQTTLTVKWNFLSEEFLEYIGSPYQDYFQVVILRQDGTEDILLNKTVDGLAADFGATKDNPGNLVSVSPAIVFDQGGVYMTNWKTSTFNISAYAGKRITLILRTRDIGDSAFDTAVLLDDISVH